MNLAKLSAVGADRLRRSNVFRRFAHGAPRREWRNRWPLGGSFALALALGGCNSLYLHREGDVKAAEEVSQGLSAAKAAELGALDAQSGAFAELFQRQRAAVIERAIQRREQVVVQLLDDPASNTGETLDNRLRELVSDDEARKLKNEAPTRRLAGARDTLKQERAILAARNGDIRAQARSDMVELVGPDPVGSLCQSAGTPPPLTGTSTPPALTSDDPLNGKIALIDLCQDYNKLIQELETKIAELRVRNPATAAAIGFAVPDTGELGKTSRQLEALNSLLLVQAKIAAAAEKALKETSSEVECAKAQAAGPGIDDGLRQAAAILGVLLGKKESDSSSAADNNDGAGSKCLNLADKELLAILRANGPLSVDPDTVNKLLSATSNLKLTSSLSAAIVEARARLAQSTLGKSLVAVATSDPAAPPSCDEDRVSCVAVRAVSILGYIENYSQAATGRLPDTSASLVGLARARFDADFAGVETARLAAARDLLVLKLTAQVNEVDSLIDAHKNLVAGRSERAVRRIGLAWNTGRIPATAVDWDLKNETYVSWLKRQKILVITNYDIMEPGAVLLTQYAAGGITGEDVARWLQTGLLGWIGYGVN